MIGGTMTHLIIVRGLIGSGKTTLAKSLANGSHHFNLDDMFIVDGEYKFDQSKFQENLEEHNRRIRQVWSLKPQQIVVDGCFTKCIQVVKLLRSLGDLRWLTLSIETPSTEWANDPFTCAKMNQHAVPLEKILAQHNVYEAFTIEDVLEALADDLLEQDALRA